MFLDLKFAIIKRSDFEKTYMTFYGILNAIIFNMEITKGSKVLFLDELVQRTANGILKQFCLYTAFDALGKPRHVYRVILGVTGGCIWF